MRTKRIKLYKYSELNIKAKVNAVDQLNKLYGQAIKDKNADMIDKVVTRKDETFEYLANGTIYTEQ